MPAYARHRHAPRPLGLLFPGQGSQHVRMAAGLSGRDPVFTRTIDHVLGMWDEEGRQLRADWLSDSPRTGIDEVDRAQPLLFAVEYALARTVLDWGVRPTALLGHSVGELVAATLAGVLRLSGAVTLLRARVREMAKIPPGGMLAVSATARQLLPHLRGDVAIAAVNAPTQTTLAGSALPLAQTAAALRAARHTVIPVPATRPYHCAVMAPAADAVRVACSGVRLRPPALPLYSGYTGGLMTDEDACGQHFWARQLTDTVYFASALEESLAVDDMLLVEIGPQQTLTAFARRHRAVRCAASVAVPSLPARPGAGVNDRVALLAVARRLAGEGHDVQPERVAQEWRPSPESGRERGERALV